MAGDTALPLHRCPGGQHTPLVGRSDQFGCGTLGARAIGTDELDIINAIVERAALSIDNARLLAESRKTAEKERVIGEISSKVSSFTNRDNILQAAVAEIGRALPGAEVVIQLQKKNDTDS